VYDVAQAGQNEVQSDQVQVSVTVPIDQAPQVTQAASAGGVAVALLSAGEQARGTPSKQRPAASPTAQPGAQQQPTDQPATPHARSTGRP
jgi:hypothetical protein